MRAKTLTVTETARHFSDYVNRVAYRRESFFLRKGKKIVAELRPVPAGRRLGDLPAILESLPHLTKAEARAFAKDIEKARQKLPREGLRDPWAS